MFRAPTRSVRTPMALGISLRVFLLLGVPPMMSFAPAVQAAPASSEAREQLELAKIQAEVQRLELENQRLESDSGRDVDGTTPLAPLLALLGGLVTVLGGLATIWKQITETSRQREKEFISRFHKSFASAAEKLGNESPGAEAGAAATLMALINPQYRMFYSDMFFLLVVNLKLKHAKVDGQNKRDRVSSAKDGADENPAVTNPHEGSRRVHLDHQESAVRDVLVRGFERVFPVVFEEHVALARRKDAAGGNRLFTAIDRVIRTKRKDTSGDYSIDLTRIDLTRADLSGLDAGPIVVDVAYATLAGANFVGSKFRRLRGIHANLKKARLSRMDLVEAGLNHVHAEGAMFDDANLVSAKFKSANLVGASFRRARLQEAHFEKARLEGARFEGADLNNAYFWKAHFDEVALQSIAHGHNWRKAHFDQDVKDRLHRYSDSDHVTVKAVSHRAG